MEKIELKLINLKKMSAALKRSINKLNKETDQEYIEFLQDSVAARFKILIESTWKILKLYLEQEKFSDIPASPKGIIQICKEAGLISSEEAQKFVSFLDLRNLASHLYDQPQYLLVINAAPNALTLIEKIVEKIKPQSSISVSQ